MTGLENEETLVVQVDAASLEQRLDFCVGTRSSVDCILAGVVLERLASNDEVRAWDDFIFFRAGLLFCQKKVAQAFKPLTYLINDFSEVNFDAAILEIGIASGVVNEFREFGLPHFRCAIPEYKEKRVDRVGFP
jgi:hypothetical protein